MPSLGYTPMSKPTELADEDVYNAFIHYTGVPEALGGGIGVLGFNITMQSGQAKFMLSKGLYKGTFLSALKTELFWGTIAMALILTAIDPEHKIEGGGLDETRFYKKHLEGTWTQIKANALTETIPLLGKLRVL